MKTVADIYLEQRIIGASPEKQAALLMEAGQLFLSKAIRAINDKQYFDMAKYLGRVTDILLETTLRLNRNDGGELVTNLQKIYGWWTDEILEASRTKDTTKLLLVSKHMGVIRQAWEELETGKSVSIVGNSQPVAFVG